MFKDFLPTTALFALLVLLANIENAEAGILDVNSSQFAVLRASNRMSYSETGS
jgi:hypothetical protein